MDHLAAFLKEFLHPMAEISASVLELIGILIIIIGSCNALFKLLKNLWKKREFHVVVALGKALSLALEFKMGAEIINTVIICRVKTNAHYFAFPLIIFGKVHLVNKPFGHIPYFGKVGF